MHRTHTCGELHGANAGENIILSGWVNKIRNLGGMIFIDLRDRYGITQVFLDPQNQQLFDSCDINSIKQEYVLKISGIVNKRPDSMINSGMSTGEIEILAQKIEIITKSKVLPFQLEDDPRTSEENRYKHRYLDLRRRKVLSNIEFRAKMNQFTRNWFSDRKFLEVQTPIFTVSSPEGARDYLIPSRVNPGKFYALPQSPQQYKQLLMIGGIDKYFQIAPCFRDEDPRADRHSCEFYQVDCEMSFVEQEDVLQTAQSFVHDLITNFNYTKEISKQITVDFRRLTHYDAFEKYGSDKPDLRFGLEFIDVGSVFEHSDFSLFSDTVKNGGALKVICLPGKILSRKELDSLTDVAKSKGAGGLPYLAWTEEGIKGSIAKFITEDIAAQLTQLTNFKQGDTLLFGVGTREIVGKGLNQVRLSLRDTQSLVNPHHLAFVWITNFPFYEMNDEGKLDFAHNPFSHVTGGAHAVENTNPLELISEQYDMVCNGYEILSGSIRNHDSETLIKVFEKVGKGEKEVKAKFGAMYEAFQYGAPPHGGFAFGFDRLLMILKDEPNIREIYAFPKSGRAEDVMMGAPDFITEEQLKENSLKLDVKE